MGDRKKLRQEADEKMLKDLVLKNRSYRGFDESVRISRETLEGFVDCARLCPSSVNKQPLKYFLAWEPEEVEKVQGLTKWARALPDMVLPHPGKRPTGFVVICQDKRIDENLNRYQKDVGIVAQTMLLAAVEQGLGGCMIGNFQAGEVMEVLGLPEEIRPLLIVALENRRRRFIWWMCRRMKIRIITGMRTMCTMCRRERWRMNC